MNASAQRLSAYLAAQPVFSTTGLTRLYVNEHAVGWLEPATLSFLREYSPQFQLIDGAVYVANLADPSALSSLFTQAARAMQSAGLIRGWRDENYTCYASNTDGTALDLSHPLFELERAAFRRFGLISRAVHINGYTAEGLLWIGRRAPNKSIDPNHLDNLAAGGLPVGESPLNCVIRELWEEAGVPPTLAQSAGVVGTVRTTRNERDGTHDEIIECYDLLLPADFVPHNTDGEVAGFTAFNEAEAVQRLAEFTWDAGLVTAQFLQRHGWV